LDEVERPKLHFKIQPWRGGSSGSTAAEGGVAAEGDLTDLWATPDPPPGLCLFFLRVPRRNATPMRRAAWMFVAPWKLSFFPATLDQVHDQQQRKALAASEPAERRSEPILTYPRFGALNQGFGPSHRLDGYAVVATVAQSLPTGQHRLDSTSSGGFSFFHNGNLLMDAWTRPAVARHLMNQFVLLVMQWSTTAKGRIDVVPAAAAMLTAFSDEMLKAVRGQPF
jgi:hypothetical protein